MRALCTKLGDGVGMLVFSTFLLNYFILICIPMYTITELPKSTNVHSHTRTCIYVETACTCVQSNVQKSLIISTPCAECRCIIF